MQSDFEPKALKEAHQKLDKHLHKLLEEREVEKSLEKEPLSQNSLWTKLLRLFK